MEREYSLDVLKCVATIGIIFHHYQQLTGAWFVGGLNFWNGKFYWGYLVELFFILSGYFTWHYIPRIQKDSKALYFIGKKYIRFFPLLVITGCVCTILELYYFRSGENPFTRTIWDWVMGILGIRQWFGDLFTVNNPLWYISVLLLCYLVFFTSTWTAKKLNCCPHYFYALIIIWGITMRELSNPSGDGIPLVSFAIGRGYTGFFWGILLREINERYHFDRLRIIPLVTGAWIIVFILMFLYREHYIGDDLWNILCFMVFPAVVLFFGHQNVEKYFSVTLFKNVGDVTLHVFVWHYPVLLAVLILSKYTYLNFNSIVAMLLTTMIIFLVGILSYIFYVNMSKVPWSVRWNKNQN